MKNQPEDTAEQSPLYRPHLETVSSTCDMGKRYEIVVIYFFELERDRGWKSVASRMRGSGQA